MSPRATEPIPHRFPFRLVERSEAGERQTVAVALATAGGALTGTGPWPATLVTEALAQAILAVVGAPHGGRLRLVGLDNVTVFRAPAPGDRMEVEVSEVAGFGPLRRYLCRGMLAGGLAAVAEVTVSS